MKVYVNLEKAIIENEVEVISAPTDETSDQGFNVYEVEEIKGKVYLDKEIAEMLIMKAIQEELSKGFLNFEVVTKIAFKKTCQKGFEWIIGNINDYKICDDEENLEFEGFEV